MKIWDKLEPADIIAMIIFIGIIIANWRGFEIMIPLSAALIIGYYFGHSTKKYGNH